MGAGIAAAVAAVASIGYGVYQGEQAKKEQKKAEAAYVEKEDAQQRALLNALRQRQRYAEAGASRMSALKKRMAEESGAQAQANIARGAGGSSGGYIDALLRSQNITQRQLMQGAAETEATADRYLMAQAPIVSDMADRRLSLQTYARDVASGRAAALRQSSEQNIMAGISMGASGMKGIGGGTPQTTTTPALQNKGSALDTQYQEIIPAAAPGTKTNLYGEEPPAYTG